MRILRTGLAVASALVLATPVVDFVAPGFGLSSAVAATGEEDTKEAAGEAKTASARAVVAYKAGEHAEAITAWKRAFELAGKDTYLFNIAKAYEKLGDKGEAARYYAKYAAVAADAKRKAKAEKKVEELGGVPETAPVEDDAASSGAAGMMAPDLGEGEGEGDEGDPASLEAPVGMDDADGDDDAAPLDMSEPEPEKKKLAPFPFVTIGVGVVGVALGVVFGQLARIKAGELEELTCTPGASSCAPFNDKDSEAFRVHDTGRMFNTLQIVGYVMGGVFVATGLTVFAIGSAGKDDDVRAGSAGPGITASVTPVIGPGTVGASARLTF